ncbi:hypothetical protein [Shewanella sp.]|uniref:hypothetical protein n=1 Tax=Shewanella sp. TaxID=50422 RepID=UPI003A987334
MPNYPTVRQLLSLFSVDVGLEEAAAHGALINWLSEQQRRQQLSDELQALLQDSSISLVELLDNPDFVVYPADDEQDARQYILATLWQPLTQMTP